MKRETQTIWWSEDGTELLRHKRGDVFYIPLSDVKPIIMRELRDALTDALSDELVQAINQAKGNKP